MFEDKLGIIEKNIGFFDCQVLAGYYNEPDKYSIKTDFFEGSIETTSEFILI